MIAIIDYGAGNLRSVVNALAKLGYQPKVTRDPDDMLNATAVIFPGVGAAADAIKSLRESGLDEAIRESIRHGQPVFAICVGMQVLLSATEEGGWSECLGIIPGAVKRLPSTEEGGWSKGLGIIPGTAKRLSSGLKVPHIGWNQVKQINRHRIFEGIPDESNFYFVHSYYAEPKDESLIAGTTEYGINMCSVLIKDNLVATQFHPEKSGRLGLRMYDNFLKMAGVKEKMLCRKWNR
jgi:glutamine amidotransferase